MKHLILWDIDGTILRSGGVAGESLRAAMTRTFGAITGAPFAYAGMTDRQILFNSYPDHDQTALLDQMPGFIDIYMEELSSRREEYARRGGPMPGVREVLQRLQQTPDVLQTLLTGNIKDSARAKLSFFGLDHYLDIEIGAYGSDHHHRPALVPFAVQRAAERYGRTFSGQEIVVIGDTPNDVACGKANGARTIAVATGEFTSQQLRETGADAVLENLLDTEIAIKLILGK